jgi:hypothetical protein
MNELNFKEILPVGTALIHLVEWTGGYDETNKLFYDCAEAFKSLTSLIQPFPSSHAVFAKHV